MAYSSQFDVCKLGESTLHPIIQIINENTNEMKALSNTDPWGISLVTDHQLDFAALSLTIQTIFPPSNLSHQNLSLMMMLSRLQKAMSKAYEN